MSVRCAKRWSALGGLLLLAAGCAFLRRQRRSPASAPKEIASGVWWLETGRGLMETNVYFVRSGSSWVLIDAAWPKRGEVIKQAAEQLFGANARPAAMLLTHIHPDHSGSAPELAWLWDVPVWVHPDELPLAVGGYLPEYANPLDRWLVAPLLRVVPRQSRETMRAQGRRFADAVRAFDPSTGVPSLPDWECIPTPGHTPGHVAYFRPSDRVLIAGDALLTVNTNSPWDWVRQKQNVAGPPYISTWNWQAAKKAVAVLARLEPLVLAAGHGVPMTGPATARDLRAFADRFAGSGASGRDSARSMGAVQGT
jgi:glyoxylase-like metal-dependent hydrolase (beta-lactamase superfamily II)